MSKPYWTAPPEWRAHLKNKAEEEEYWARKREERDRLIRAHGGPPPPAPAPTPPPAPPKPPSIFYVRVSPNREYARLHRGECWLCKDGQGKAGKMPVYIGGNYWTKGFAKLDDAKALVASLGFADVAACPHCRPG